MQQTVNLYVNALNENDFVLMYEFLHPDCKKEISRTEFVQRANIKCFDTKIESVKFLNSDKSKARVVLNSKMKSMGYTFKNFITTNDWSLYKAKWYIWMNLSKEKMF